MQIIQRGAEAVLYLDKFEGETALVKERIKKGYRLSEIDSKIRKQRTVRESSLLSAARRSGIPAPRVLDAKEDKIIMEFLGGKRLKDVLNSMPDEEREETCRRIGETIAGLHAAGIIHGDLTTSNMILKDGKPFIIDFGLGKTSKKAEERATDLYLLFEALKAAHYRYLKVAWENILNAYKHNYSNSSEVLKQFGKIEKRRRYKG